jgi:hypothetical protein
MNVRYRVTLTQYERNGLGTLLSGGKHPVRKLKRAQILLQGRAHSGGARQPVNPFRGRALYQTFPADEARRVLRRLEFHYVPKHASWLNMVEIEIGVMASQCLDRRIESYTPRR